MENRSSSSDLDALPAEGGLAGGGAGGGGGLVAGEGTVRVDVGEGGEGGEIETQSQEPAPAPAPATDTNAKAEKKEETADMMDLDVALSEEKAAPPPITTPPSSVVPEPLTNNADTPEPAEPAIPTTAIAPNANRAMTPPPPPAAPPLSTPPQQPRDLRQILQAAGSIRTQQFPRPVSVPPSPVVKPGALHEFEVLGQKGSPARRRSSATAGIAGLEELRNRIAEEGSGEPGSAGATNMGADLHGPFDQLIQASGVGAFMETGPQRTPQVIDAFVRLDFDDGHVYYVRNSSVVFGRMEGASSSSFQQLGPDGSTVIGSGPFGGFDPTTTPGAMSMKREKKKRRKKKSATSKKSKSTTSGASSTTGRGSMVQMQGFAMYRDSFAMNPYPFASAQDEVPIIHLPLRGSGADMAAAPPKKNISRKHAILAYNFAKRRFELKITGKNGAFVEDEFVHCNTTWVVGQNGMRVQIGGVGFKVVLPEVPGGGFEVEGPGRGKGKGKGKMSLSFTDEHGNEVRSDFSDDEDVAMEEGEGSRDSDESMEGESEEGSGDEEEDEDEEEGEDDEEAQEGDVENSEGEDSDEESDEEEATPPPEPVKVEKKRGRGRPRKDESEVQRQEQEKAKAKELARQKEREKERRAKEKLDAARRAKEAEREKAQAKKRLEIQKAKEERQKQKEKQQREKEREKEQKKLHLSQQKQKEEPKKAAKLYLPTPATKKKEVDKSLTSQTAKKGPGRPPKVQPEPKQGPPALETATVSVSPTIPEPEQAFSPNNPLMAVAAFNATAPPIDPQLYHNSSSYSSPVTMHPHATAHKESTKPVKEPKPKKEKLQPKKRTPSPELNEADYPPEALLKPAASYVILIHEAITNSEQKALTLPQIYKAIERKYPYFKLRVTTTGWQSSVRHNLGAHKAFCKVTRSGKGWLWGVNEGVSIEKEKNKANIAASRPPAYQQPLPQGMVYANGAVNGHAGYQQNGYPGVPMYTQENHMGMPNGARPQYQQQAYAHPHAQPSRIPPMPMPYQPPTTQQQHAAATVAAVNGNQPRQQLQSFPNAPIPSPAGSSSQAKTNGASPENAAAIILLQKQIAQLTGNPSVSTAGINVSLLSQAQNVLAGLMSGKLRGNSVDVVKKLTALLESKTGPVWSGGAAGKSTQVSPPVPAATPVQAASQSTSTQAQATAVKLSAVDYKNLPPEKKKALYIALLAAKAQKEKELKAAAAGGSSAVAASPTSTKRALENGGGEPVPKKVDIGTGGSGSA